MSEQHEISQLVTAVFRAWQQAKINCLVLRNYEGLPHFTTNDVDVLVDPGHLRKAEEVLLEVAAQSGFRLHNRVEYATLALYLSGRESNAQAHFDLFTTLKWRGFEFVASEGFLRRKVGRELFFIPHPADETVTKLLASLIYTGEVKEKYKADIAARLRAEPTAMMVLLARVYGPAQARFLVEAGAQEKWAEIEAATGQLRRALIVRQLTRRPWRTVKSLLQDAKRLAGRWLWPPGMTVVLCGADGSGKSTVARAVLETLGVTFPEAKVRQFHWKPPLFSARRQAARQPTTDPHGQAARNPAVLSAILVFTGWSFSWAPT